MAAAWCAVGRNGRLCDGTADGGGGGGDTVAAGEAAAGDIAPNDGGNSLAAVAMMAPFPMFTFTRATRSPLEST